MLLIFKKIDEKWKIIYGVESYIQKNVKNTEISKDLNQVELHKRIIGYWKSEVAKDTTCLWDVKSYGTGFECYFKYVTNGNVVMDGKQLWGYDNNLDKFTMAEMIKGMDNKIFASWFISKDKCEMLPIEDISNPDQAQLKWELEFKSPGTFIQTTIAVNKPNRTDTWTRVK
jgi:hypothetical protein